MIVLNLFIGVIMNAMNEVREEVEERIALEKALKDNSENSVIQHVDNISKKIEELQKELQQLKRRF
jgi:seryl-tRNA synthetase